MSRAAIDVGGSVAVLENWNWQSDDKALESLLNQLLDTDGPSGADPQPSITEARRVAKELGGTVLATVEGKSEPGRIY